MDDKYNYQYNGECLESCPIGTINQTGICTVINKNKCTYSENNNSLSENLSNEELELLVMRYAKEYIYTNYHISLYKNDLFSTPARA